MSPEEALVRATAHYRETAAGRYRCSIRVAGDPQLGAKCIVGLWGEVAPSVAGLYYVREAVTDISAGQYTMELIMRKDAKGESPVSKKRRPRSRVNQSAYEVMDFTTFEGAPVDVMHTMLTGIVDPSGVMVPAYIWTADGGKTGQTSELTAEEFEALPLDLQTAWHHGPVELPDR